MDDDFYSPVWNATTSSPGLLSSVWQSVVSSPASVLVTSLLFIILVIVGTRLLSGQASVQVQGTKNKTVLLHPYWIPVVGHAYQILSEPLEFMSKLRDQSPHGIFALNLGATTHNIISDPQLVKSVMSQRESVLLFEPIAWNMVSKFFGVPQSSWPKYQHYWTKMTGLFSPCLMREPALGKLTQTLVRRLELNIPQMISFLDADIDLQPWERRADATFISNTETEINLMSLMRDMMGNASVPAIFGHAFLEKYPDILHDVYDMDKGMYFFLIGLPSWFPWPGVMQAHLARQRVWQAMDDLQRAMDSAAQGKHLDSSWGDLDDIGELILKRNEIYREGNFGIKERADSSILWALAINANMLVYWNILYIVSTPGLVARIREEIDRYITVLKPLSIGAFSEAPKMTIVHEGLSSNCPLLKSSYLEALRLSDQPWSVRKVASDVSLSGDKNDPNSVSFSIKKGEYVTVPHDLHMRDPHYFKDPDKFIPDRFIVCNADGTEAVDAGTIRPYGGGPSICKGRIFAERECLSLVAGILAYWEIEPADKKVGFVVPKMQKTAGVSRPIGDTRVRVKRRKFAWEE